MQVNALQVAQHIDRIRRSWVVGRPDAIAIDIEGGWMLMRPGADPGTLASSCANRVYWLAPPSPPGPSAIAAAIHAAQSHACRRLFIWLAPWSVVGETELALRDAGAHPVPHVEYPAFVRDASPPADCPTEFDVRPVTADRAADVMHLAASWYGADNAAAVVRLVHLGACEVHAAFDGQIPVAVSLLTFDGDWAYLGAAVTRHDRQRRGAQSAMIVSRLRSAHARGVVRSACESSSMSPSSMKNIQACGFRPAFNWRLYRWEAAT